jgi:hypothetical protein
VDADFLYDKAAVVGAATKETLLYSLHIISKFTKTLATFLGLYEIYISFEYYYKYSGFQSVSFLDQMSFVWSYAL